MSSARGPNSRSSATSPGAGPLDPSFDVVGYTASLMQNLRETGIYFLHSDGTEHMPVGSEWNYVDLTPRQRAENDEFHRIRQERRVEHGQRLSASVQLQGAMFVVTPTPSTHVRVAR
eukprot:10889114-Lingulodinium_polyedra.AAC.1